MRIYIPRNIGIAVRKRRIELNMRQSDLAKTSGISERTIISLEAGNASGVRLDKLMCVLDALGLELHIEGLDTEDTPFLAPRLD